MPKQRPTGSFNYRLFGLAIRSDLELPELVASPPADADICISQAEIAAGKESLAIAGIARFLVTDGAEICVQPEPGAESRNVRLYLLGSAMGLLLHQRGLLPLHASAVEVHGRAIAFLGPSGSGKSTLAAWFNDKGFPVLADDVCVVRFDGDGSPIVMPGMPRMRLWKDALKARGHQPGAFERSYAGDDDWEKYDVPLEIAVRSEKRLAAIYLLDRGEKLAIEPIEGLATAEALFAHTYRGAFVASQGDAVGHWHACMALAGQVAVFRLCRHWDLAQLDEQAGRILAHASGL